MPDIDNTLATILDDVYVRVTPPTEEDSESVVDMKMFILACFTRRNSDPEFELELKRWFRELSETDIRAINGVNMQ